MRKLRRVSPPLLPQVHCTYAVLGLGSEAQYTHLKFIQSSSTPCSMSDLLLFVFYPENRDQNFGLGKGLMASKAGLADGWLIRGLEFRLHKVAGRGLSSSALLPRGGIVCSGTLVH